MICLIIYFNNNVRAKEHTFCIHFPIFVLVHQYKVYKYYGMLDQMNIYFFVFQLANEAYNTL